MTTIDSDFDSILKQVEDKVRTAEKLLLEASQLATTNNISVDQGDINNLFNIINGMPVELWEDSESTYDAGAWQSSSNIC